MRKSFEYIVEQATTDKGFRKKDLLYFHSLNPNGIKAEQRKLDNRVHQLVVEGKVKSGWYLAHGSLSHNFTREMEQRLHRRKRVTTRDVESWVWMMKNENERTVKSLTEIGEA